MTSTGTPDGQCDPEPIGHGDAVLTTSTRGADIAFCCNGITVLTCAQDTRRTRVELLVDEQAALRVVCARERTERWGALLVDLATALAERVGAGWDAVAAHEHRGASREGPALVHPYTGAIAWATGGQPPAPGGHWWVERRLTALRAVPVEPNGASRHAVERLRERGTAARRTLLEDAALRAHPDLTSEALVDVVDAATALAGPADAVIARVLAETYR